MDAEDGVETRGKTRGPSLEQADDEFGAVRGLQNGGRGQGKSTSSLLSRAIRPRWPGCARDGEGSTTDEKINE